MPVKQRFISKSMTSPFERTDDRFPSNNVKGSDKLILKSIDTRVTSSNIPKWKSLMKAGNNVTTELIASASRQKFAVGQVSTKQTYPGGTQFVTTFQQGNILLGTVDFPTQSCDGSVISKATDLAQINFAKSYRKTTQNFNGGPFCAEIVQVARQITSPARGIFNGIPKVYKGVSRWWRYRNRFPPGSKPFRDAGKAMGETWIEWAFSIKPLISDVDDAATALRALASGRGFDMVRCKGTGQAAAMVPGLSGVRTFSQHSGFPNDGFTVARDVWDEAEVTIRGAWKNTNPSGEMPVLGRFGLTTLDVIPTIWEEIPWSFLVDYFFNVGDTLDAWQMRFITFAWLNQTARSSRIDRYSDVRAPATSSFNSRGFGGNAMFTKNDVHRQAINNEFRTGFHVNLPTPGTKWLNMGALLAMKVPPR